MTRRHFLRGLLACACALAVGLCCGACASDESQAKDVVTALMEAYVVPVPDEEGKEPEDSAWPAEDFGDAATMEVLEGYDVSADEWRRHCLKNLSYEVGDATVDGDAATVSVTVTNASLSSAVAAAGADFATYAQTQEAEDAYAQGGRAALFNYLVDRLYAHLDANEAPVTTTVEVMLAKGDDGWVADVAGNEAFFSALYGGSNVVAGLGAVPAQ